MCPKWQVILFPPSFVVNLLQTSACNWYAWIFWCLGARIQFANRKKWGSCWMRYWGSSASLWVLRGSLHSLHRICIDTYSTWVGTYLTTCFLLSQIISPAYLATKQIFFPFPACWCQILDQECLHMQNYAFCYSAAGRCLVWHEVAFASMCKHE